MTVQYQIPVWLDCDPGNDDTFGILLAAFHPRFKLLGISTVHGNAPLHKTTHNAVALLDVLGFKQDQIKVYPGAEEPLKGEPLFAAHIHGDSGIGGATLPESPKIKPSNDIGYLEAMRDSVLQYPNQICIVCTGTLTNFAQLIIKYPEVKSKIRFLSLMGGALDMGNITSFAEFNLYCDPKASEIVLNDPVIGPKSILAPLNITHTAVANSAVRLKIYNPQDENSNSSIREMFYKIIMFYSKAYETRYGIIEGPPLHDPVAIFSLLPLIQKQQNPEEDLDEDYKYHYLRRKLTIVQDGEHKGETLVKDNDSSIEEEDGSYIGLNANIDLFWEYILDSLKLADEQVFGSK